MTWLFPAGIVAGLSLGVIVLLHMRHRLPEVITFPQLAFWPRVPSETRESPRWRKPPLSLLFLLQLLAALLLVLAFMRPAVPGLGAFGAQRTSAIHHVIVLDGSTSMLATSDDERTRWDVALDEVDGVLGGWQHGDGVTVIVASGRPIVRSAADQRQLDEMKAWLDTMAVPGGVPDDRALSSLLAGTALPSLDRHLTLITDGGLELDAPGVSLDRITVEAGDAGNVAIVSTSTSPRDSGGHVIEATVLHDRPGTETLPWVARADQQELASGTLTLGAGQQGTFSVQVPADTGPVTLEVVASDAMTADNRAIVDVAGDALTGIRIVLVSDVPGPTRRALEVLPGAMVETYPSTTPGISAIAASADLVVYEASAPAEGDFPNVPMLLVQPTGVSDGWQITGVSPDPGISDVAIDDPVLRDVSLEGIRFGETPIYVLQDDADVLVSGTESNTSMPLIWRGALGGQPYIAYAFDPSSSNMVDRVTFPILVAQTTGALAGTDRRSVVGPGELVSLNVPEEAASVRVEDPAGDAITLVPVASGGGSPVVTFAATARPGIWNVVVEGAAGAEIERGSIVVNAGDIRESELRSGTTTLVSMTDAAPGATDAPAAGDGDVLADIWPLLVIASIAVIGLEWWVWLSRSMAGRRVVGGQAS